ncbi:Alpha/Beta hydrolase protein [Pseudomassariella vexata]|uniref:Alpha/Beta hydrolase protein n=1 Tax=Pseudomassariella vexata TaxID=1141098 RepID=A0A1Y2DI39_9PEZI|nr:Alpha/Beta hydrolase protein [Pseudomassariella vexata]ORY58898.1 Alpha/Beta hydrolase protein [Pseudomassariella vexata]
MMYGTKPRLSILETLGMVLLLVFMVPPQLGLNITRCLFLAWQRGISLRYYVTCAANRVFLGGFSPRQLQNLVAPSAQTYAKWVKRKLQRAGKSNDAFILHRVHYDVHPLTSCGGSMMWIGDRKKATKFVLFFHGGGYITPLLQGHVEWCWQAYVVAGQEVGVEVAVCVLEYTLIPAARYPHQLIQATTAFNEMLRLGIKPGDIIIGGDSAGGNLATQLLGHLMTPHPTTPPVNLVEPLRGVFLVSPFVSHDTDTPSHRINKNIDMLPPVIAVDLPRQLLSEGPWELERRQGQGGYQLVRYGRGAGGAERPGH